MKKSLSILLILSLVLTMFSGVAFAADSASGTELKGYGVIKGDASGDLMEASKWKRQDVVVILTRLLGKESLAMTYGNTHGFTDVVDPYYNGFISWAKDQKLLNGRETTTFGYNDDITYQEFAAVLLRSLGYTSTLEVPFEGVPAKSIEIGLTPPNTNMQTAVNRDAYFDLLIKAINTKNTAGVVLGSALKLTGFKEKTLTVSSVSAITTRVDENADGQYLSLSINGELKATSVKDLTNAGYTVQFKITRPEHLKNSETGELDAITMNKGNKFEYSVIVTKNDVKIESKSVSVSIVSFAETATKILSYKLFYNTDVEVKDLTITIRDTLVKFDSIQVEMLDGNTKTYTAASNVVGEKLTDLKFTTSSVVKATINTDGTIIPIGSGNVSFKITKDNASLDVPVTISSEERKATKVTSSLSTVKIVNALMKTIELVVTDQFNTPLKGFPVIVTGTPISIKKTSTETIIAKVNETTVGSGLSDKEGKVSLTLTAETPVTSIGLGKFEIKDATNANRLLNTIVVEIGKSGNDTITRRLELVNSTAALTLDIKNGSVTKNLELRFNKYDINNYYQGFEDTSINTNGSTTYTLESSDITIATISLVNGLINVQGVKKGSASIRILEGSVPRSSLSITVVDTTPVINSVTFEPDYTLTTLSKINLNQILKTSGIDIGVPTSTTNPITITNDGIIYIEVTGNGYSALQDLTLGSITLYTYVRKTSDGTVVNIMLDAQTIARKDNSVAAVFASGDKGQIVVAVSKAGGTFASFTKVITLDIP